MHKVQASDSAIIQPLKTGIEREVNFSHRKAKP